MMQKYHYITIIAFLLFIHGMAQPSGKYGGGNNDGFAYAESINNVLSLQDQQIAVGTSIYPNPVAKTDNALYFTSLLKGDINTVWYDSKGVLLHNKELRKNTDKLELPLPEIVPGVYILSIKKDKKVVLTEKIVVQ